MKKRLWFQKLLLLLVILALLIFSPHGPTAFSRLSQDFFRCLLKHEGAREVFDLEEEEAVEVFGALGKEEWV